MMTMHTPDTRIDSITAAAGAGFRLSLVLNAVKMKMASADSEITKISKALSDFSLMLKQVSKAMEEGGVIATQLAVDTALDIKDHSERIFQEIKNMTELAQVRDEKGNLTEIGIGQKVTWPRPTEKFMMQERAEIQNMIVLQHSSYEELKSLYSFANDEARQDSNSPNCDDPPPRYDDPASDEIRLAITASPRPPKEEENTSTAMVQYHEQPLQQLDESLYQALVKENSTLSAPVPDIVNHLLHEWTQPEYPGPKRNPNSRALAHKGPSHKNRRYMPRISDEEEDTTESEYDESCDQARGYYLEGPRPNGVKKNVRFRNQQAKVEDDADEEDLRPKRSSRKHIINSDEYSSDSSQSSTFAHRPPHSRDSNSSSSRYEPPSNLSYDRNRRPYTSGPSGPRNSPPEKEAVRPGFFNNRPPPTVNPRAMPMQMPNQPWQGHGTNSPGLRPPSQFNVPASLGPSQRRHSGGPYVPQPYMQSPSTSPVATHGAYFPPRQPGPGPPPPGQAPPPGLNQQRPRRPRSNYGSRQSSERAEKDKKSASRNITKGLGIGAAAAGLIDLLSGLDAI
ncbi:MAG: hypothetical protein Q9217_003527 [Psora testacea]